MHLPLSTTLLVNDHLAELQRHAKNIRIARAGRLERRTVRILRHWTNA